VKVIAAVLFTALSALWVAIEATSRERVLAWLTAPVSGPRFAVLAVMLTSGSLALMVAWLIWRTRDVKPSVADFVPPPNPSIAEPPCSEVEEKIMRYLASKHEHSDNLPVSTVTRVLQLQKIVALGAVASLRARNWAWEQNGTIMLSEVGMQIAVTHGWHLTKSITQPEPKQLVEQPKPLAKEHEKILQVLHSKFPNGMTIEAVLEHVLATRASTEMHLDELAQKGFVIYVKSFGYGEIAPAHWKLTKEGRNYGVSKGYDLIS
jgi:hypothetical protein